MSTRQILACLYFLNFLLALCFPAKMALSGVGWLLMSLGCVTLDAAPFRMVAAPASIRLRNPLWIAGHTLLTSGVFVLFVDLVRRRFFA